MPWMVTAIVVRELLIQGLRSHLEGQGQAFGAGRRASSRRSCSACRSRPSCSASRCCLVRPIGVVRPPRRADLAGRRPDALQWPELYLDRLPQAARRVVTIGDPTATEHLIILTSGKHMEWLESLVLGVVQGITEFLPVSSDGHLLLIQNVFAWLTGKQRSGKENLFFDVILHLGTTCAILVYYRAVDRPGLARAAGRKDVSPEFRRPSLVRVGVLAAVATSPLVPLALFFKKAIEQTFEGITVAGYGFLDHGGGAAGDRLAPASRWDQRAGGNDLAGRPLDRDRADVRAVAGREPQRIDDRDGAGARASPKLGGRLQPAHGRAGDPRCSCAGSMRHIDPRCP